MCVAADCSIPSFDFFQVLPPSALRQTPPRYFATLLCRHILGRGKSCVQLFTLQTPPRTSRSNPIHGVESRQSRGTHAVELVQGFPPVSLREGPMSVVGMN